MALVPPALPPRAPPSSSSSSSSSSFASALRHPLITAADYSDRERLLSHVTALSGQLQRAELLLRGAAPDAARLAAFDPLIAERHIARLDGALAQVALLREAERRHCRAVEDELRELRGERAQLVARVDAAESRAEELARADEQQRAALAAAEIELAVLRSAEANAVRRAGAMAALREDGGRFDGVRVIVAPQKKQKDGEHEIYQQQMLQENEASERAALLLEMLMEPMGMAFDAGVVWMTETKRIQDEECAALRRARQMLRDEQKRTEEMAKTHCAQLESVHRQVVHERLHVMESLTAEVEDRMRHAFRDGRLYEKRLMEERRRMRHAQITEEKAHSERDASEASSHAKKGDGGECDTASKRC